MVLPTPRTITRVRSFEHIQVFHDLQAWNLNLMARNVPNVQPDIPGWEAEETECGSGRDDFFLLSGNQLLPPKAFLASCLLGSFERNGQLWHLYKIHSYICLPTNFMMLFVCYQSAFPTCMWMTHLNVTHHLYCLYLFQTFRTHTNSCQLQDLKLPNKQEWKD